ncbi:hypothetical protein HDU76_004023, partial [Blyttiomyces sp. JEL0837]
IITPLISFKKTAIPFLSSPLTFMLVYLWSRRNTHIRMNFLGLFTFTAPYLPWVLLGFSLLLHGVWPTGDLVGLAVGHVYYFLDDVWPKQRAEQMLRDAGLAGVEGVEPPPVARVLRAPQFVVNLFDGGRDRMDPTLPRGFYEGLGIQQEGGGVVAGEGGDVGVDGGDDGGNVAAGGDRDRVVEAENVAPRVAPRVAAEASHGVGLDEGRARRAAALAAAEARAAALAGAATGKKTLHDEGDDNGRDTQGGSVVDGGANEGLRERNAYVNGTDVA